MKIIVGILLVAVSAVLAYPLGNEELKDKKEVLPLVIADYSTVAKAKDTLIPEEKPLHDQSAESGSSSSSSSEESSERPSSAEPLSSTTELIKSEEKLISSSEEASSEIKKPLSDEKPILLEEPAEKPIISTEAPLVPIKEEKEIIPEQKREEKKEEPKPIIPEISLPKEDEKIAEVAPVVAAPKPTELKLRKEETPEIIIPVVKSAAAIEDVVQVVKQTPSVAEESILPAVPVLKSEIPLVEPVASATTQEKIIEKPLALPALKTTEALAQAPAATPEIIKEITPIIAEEKKVEVDAAAKPQEAAILPAAIEEKKPVELELAAAEKNEKKAKAEEAPLVLESTSLPAASSALTTEQPKAVAAEASSTLPPLSPSTSTEKLPESSPSSPSS